MAEQCNRRTAIHGMNRRTFLHTMGLAAGSVVLASHLPAGRALAGQADTPAFQLAAPEPNPKPAGTLRYGVNNAPAQFDLHQSGTVANISAQAPMYDNSIPRTPLFSAVKEVVSVDPHTITFRLSEPRPQSFMLGAFATGWNVIVRKKTLEQHDYNLRNIPD